MALAATQFHHEDNKMGSYVIPLTPDSLATYEPSSLSFYYILKFDYHINHAYYDIQFSKDVGTRRRTMIDQYQEKQTNVIEVGQLGIFKSYADTYEVASEALSSFGITRSGGHGKLIDVIVAEMMRKGSQLSGGRRGRLRGLYVYVGKTHESYRCAECLGENENEKEN